MARTKNAKGAALFTNYLSRGFWRRILVPHADSLGRYLAKVLVRIGICHQYGTDFDTHPKQREGRLEDDDSDSEKGAGATWCHRIIAASQHAQTLHTSARATPVKNHPTH
jgi:hypothetical protein